MELLITGGTGTIGTALAKKALDDGFWRRVIIYSRDEYKQAMMEKAFAAHPDSYKLRFFLGDVRDLLRLEMAMEGVTHVIHAAALKRIEKCESDPIEAVKTNVEGTANVIHAAIRKRLYHVCAISTDKAVNPVSLYGSTKLTMERLVLAANNLSGGKCKFTVVRQGNIFGSRGSVFEIWKKILDSGCKTVPVTDPNATRYFITSSDAISFIMKYISSIGLKFPTNLPAYSVGDLANAMGAESLDIIGLGHNEKLHEEMEAGATSEAAPRLSIADLKKEIQALSCDASFTFG